MDAEGIQKVLTELGIDDIKVNRKDVQCACVLADYREGHSDHSNHSGSMGIHINEEDVSVVNCFSCGYRGTMSHMVSMLSMYEGVDYSALIIQIDKMEELDPEYIANNLPEYGQTTYAYVENIVDESLIAPMMGQVPRYILNRGFDLDTLKAWEAGYDEEKSRAVLPVRNSEGALVGMVGRTINNHPLKYYNYFDFDKSRYLFGENKTGAKTGVVVEGLLDAVKLWQYFKKNALLDQYSVVAILGAMPSKAQCSKLIRHFDEVIVFLDNDPAGWTGTSFLGRHLFGKVRLRSVEYPEMVGGDPDSLIESETDIASLLEASDLLLM